MASDVKEYPYIIDTLDVFPRIKRFKTDFKNLHGRFKTLIRRHTVTRDPQLEKELEDLEVLLQRPLRVIVVGKYSLELKDIVGLTEPVNHGAKQIDSQDIDTGFTFIVCNTIVEDVKTGLQEVSAIVKHLASVHIAEKLAQANNLYFICQTDEHFPEDEIGKIRCDALKHETLIQPNHFSVVHVGHLGQRICEKIVNNIESKIVHAFDKVREFLKRFIKLKRSNKLENDKDVFDFVYQAIENADLKFEQVLESVVLKTSIKDSLSERYMLPQDICSRVFLESKRAEELNLCLNEIDKRKVKNNHRKTYLSDQKACVRSFAEELHRSLILMGEISFQMRGMVCEINVDIRNSNFSLEYPEESLCIDRIPNVLREDLLQIDGVFGVSTSFGVLEIHIEPTSKSQQVKSAIAICIDKHKFGYVYNVKTLSNKPRQLCSTISCGNMIGVPNGPSENNLIHGTLGLLVNGSNQQLYALTSGHLVRAGNLPVFTVSDASKRRQIGKTVANLMPSDISPRIDIAAIQILDSVKDDCKMYMPDEDSNFKSVKIASGCPADLVGQKIYKYGPVSHLTRGIISSHDFSCKDLDDNVVVVSSLPGDDDCRYLQAGDSGSINCMSNFEDSDCVTAISLNVGEIVSSREEHPLYLSYMLKSGLEKLTSHSGIEFSMPSIVNQDMLVQ